MLVSVKHRVVILAMPKCASTALERALAPAMDMVVSGHPAAKHTPFRKYDRHLRRYLESYTDGRPLEVVCLFREPVDWLKSWWRYRGRPLVPDPAVSTRGLSFEAFVRAYADGRREPAAVGSQARFVSDRDGAVGVDRIFRYENLDGFTRWLEARLAQPITLERLSVSPSATDPAELSVEGRAVCDSALVREYVIYADMAE